MLQVEATTVYGHYIPVQHSGILLTEATSDNGLRISVKYLALRKMLGYVALKHRARPVPEREIPSSLVTTEVAIPGVTPGDSAVSI